MNLKPNNYRVTRPICCYNCLNIRSNSDGWFCSLDQELAWGEFDGPFSHVCDLFLIRKTGAIRDVDDERNEKLRVKS